MEEGQVTVDGVGGVHKHGRCSRRVERSHDLLTDDGALPDARHNDATLALDNLLNGFHKVIIQITGEL